MKKIIPLVYGALLLLGCFTCSTDKSEQAVKQENEPDVLTEDIRLLLSAHLSNADTAAIREQVDSAIFWYAEAGNLYAQHQQWDSLYLVARKIFLAAYYNNKYDVAAPHFSRYENVLAPENDTVWAKIVEMQAYSARAKGQAEEALKLYQQAAKVWEKYPVSERLLACYNMLGILYTILADFPLAETIYENAITLGRPLNDTVVLRANYLNLGKAQLSQEKWQPAIANIEKAQSLIPYTDGLYECLIAQAWLAGNQAVKALPFAEAALTKRLAFKGRGRLDPASAYSTLGDVYFNLENFNKAEAYYKQSLQIINESYPPGHRDMGKAHLFLGDTYVKQGLPELALKEYQQAIQVFLPSFQPATIYSCPSADSLLSREVWLMEALNKKGHVFRNNYKLNQQLADLEASATHYQTAVDHINQIKLYYTERGAKGFLGDYSIPFIEDAIESQLALYEATGQEDNQQRAFELAQQATAFNLRETVNEKQALEVAQVPPDTAAILYELNNAISDTQSARTYATKPLVLDSLANKLFQLKNKRLKLLQYLEQNYPTYYQLKHELAPIPLARLQEELPSGTLVIKYFLGEKTLYTFAFDKQGLQHFSTPIDSLFFTDMETYRQTLSDLDYIREKPELAEQQFIASSQRLYSRLLNPALSAFEANDPGKLVIIPDGVLNYLSFECMLKRPVDNWLETDAFLVSDYAVRYAYYTGLLLTDNEQASTKTSRFLGFGTEYSDETLEKLEMATQDSVENPVLQDAFRGKKLSKLLFADDEAIEIADLLSGESYVNNQATKANFLKNVDDYSLLHIAAHSFIDNENDSTAFIIFNQDQEQGDNLLSLQEVYQLKLKADLVTLSACQTSSGALNRSEGVMSMARAFHFAGSSSLVASQWSIVDRSSFVIMKAFYQNLKEGLPKDEALQKAKLDYLKDDQLSSPAYRIPAYWAALIMIGDESALKFQSSIKMEYSWLIIGLLLLISVFVFLKKRS